MHLYFIFLKINCILTDASFTMDKDMSLEDVFNMLCSHGFPETTAQKFKVN